MPRLRALQTGQQGDHEQALLGLPHIVLDLGLREAMREEQREPALPDLLARRADQPASHVLQHHRLQGKAARALPALDETAPAQPIDGFQQLHARKRGHQRRVQLLQGHRLAQDGQPGEYRLFQGGESGPLLLQQLADAAKDGRPRRQERVNLPAKEVGNGLGHDVQGQGIAPVSLNQTRPLLWGADQLVLRQQLLACRILQAIQTQGAHRRLSTFQPGQRGWFFPAGQQQATVVPGLGHLPQQVPIGFKARTQPPAHLAGLQQAFQVIEHQQHPRAPQLLRQEPQPGREALRLPD